MVGKYNQGSLEVWIKIARVCYLHDTSKLLLCRAKFIVKLCIHDSTVHSHTQ